MGDARAPQVAGSDDKVQVVGLGRRASIARKRWKQTLTDQPEICYRYVVMPMRT